ncbi:MAG: hypothetical protein IT558_02195 [Alphaproteobacteria bacterium]|nr:hypothetical protein [Alphaproteobacteria bacterium]
MDHAPTWFTCGAGPAKKTEYFSGADIVKDKGHNIYTEALPAEENPLPEIMAPEDLCESWGAEELAASLYTLTFESGHDVLAYSLQSLMLGRTMRALAEEAIREEWEFGLADLQGRDFFIDVPSKKIILGNFGLSPEVFSRSPYFQHSLMSAMARSLRDVWHEKRHGGFEVEFTPESVLMLERVRAADCDVTALQAAWELRAEGYEGLWRHITAAEESDLAQVYVATLEREFRSYPVHKALAAAFIQWYRGEGRVTARDHETLEYLDEGIRAGDRFGKRKATAADVEILSCLPDRTAYLQGEGAEILRGPLFAGLSDPINQSHFLQLTRDIGTVHVQGVTFRDAGLAKKIFPGE